MADQKTTALTALTTPSADDILPIVDDPGGSPVTKKITYEALAPGRLIGMQVITATGGGTYTPTTGTKAVVIELVGGGGGGGGTVQPGGSNVGFPGGGSGGGWLRKRLTANFSGASYSVGAKGTGGSAGNNAGNNGGDTTFQETGGGTTYTASGGTGGTGAAGTASPALGGGIAGGGCTNGDVQEPGGASHVRGSITSGNLTFSGRGGDSRYGHGARPATATTNSSTAGVNADGKGAGGSGAAACGSGAAQAGGDGSDGMIIIYEYS